MRVIFMAFTSPGNSARLLGNEAAVAKRVSNEAVGNEAVGNEGGSVKKDQ
jgi:hypothetical protein